ncbi:uncharacterized protein [Porites lutea]|uniref:uncharacterized protein n=1 Tax=Porites lutea TaxID=51062 RepID=UPI003CC64A45
MSNIDDVPNLSGNVNDIVNFYRQNLSSAKHAGDKAREGAVYSTFGLFFLGQCDYKKAIEYNDLALDIFKELGDKRQEGYAYQRRGDVFQKLCKFEKAREYQNRALSIAIDLGEKPLEGYAYYGLGNAFRGLCSYDKAIGFYKRCLRVAKGLADKTIRRSLEGIACSNLGHAFDCLGDYKQAEIYQRLHLSIAKERRDKSGEGDAYRGLGNVFQGLGNFRKAQEYYSLSLSIAKDVRNKEAVALAYLGLANASRNLGDTKNAIKYSNLHLTCAKELGNRGGGAYCNLGHIYKSLGDFKKSIEYFKCYLEIAKDSGDSEGEGAAYGGLGSAFDSLGDFEKAVYFHKQHLDIAKNIGDKEGEAIAHGNLGNAYLSLGDFKKALDYYLPRLSIAKDLGDKAGEGRAYGHLGSTYQHIGDYDKAMVYYDRRLCIAQELGDKAGEGAAYGNLGTVSQNIGNYMKAIDCHKQQLRIGKEIGDKGMLGIAYSNIGQCFEMLKSLPEALENYQTSVKVFNEMRSLLQSEDQWKIGFRNECNHAYTGLWRVLLKQEKIGEALAAAEEGRAQSLADLMTSQYGLKECQYKGKPLEEQEFGMLNHTLSSTTFLAANVVENKVNIWVISKEKPLLHRGKTLGRHCAKSAAETLQSLIQFAYKNIGVCANGNCEDRSLDLLRENCSGVERSSKKSSQPILQEDIHPLSALYSYVIAPILDLIDGDEIIIVPDGPLWLAPFAALLNPFSKYLCESFKVRIIPSLTSLKILAHCPEFHSSSGAVVVGDPDVSGVINSQGKQLQQLPFARKEAQIIGQILNVAPLTGKLATKCEVLKQISSVSVVHIAAHGCAETGEIALSPNPERKSQTPAEEDYMLTMADVMSVKLRAKLVVLSCCNSGRGEIKAEGVVGIARAFMAAGARSVLVSLWAIDDEATLEFMKSFYHNLVKGRSASESLNHAMKCLRESETFSDVKYWAPFTLIGDDVTLDKQEDIKVS